MSPKEGYTILPFLWALYDWKSTISIVYLHKVVQYNLILQMASVLSEDDSLN